MSRRTKISAQLQEKIRVRASFLCEYCHTPEQWQYVRFTVDHIVPLKYGGSNEEENLALACFHCNRRKGVQVTGRDPDSGEEVPLFHPRRHTWNDHFIWSNSRLTVTGRTPIGRATVETLDLNRERAVQIWAVDLLEGRHPPAQDPVENEF